MAPTELPQRGQKALLDVSDERQVVLPQVLNVRWHTADRAKGSSRPCLNLQLRGKAGRAA